MLDGMRCVSFPRPSCVCPPAWGKPIPHDTGLHTGLATAAKVPDGSCAHTVPDGSNGSAALVLMLQEKTLPKRLLRS